MQAATRCYGQLRRKHGDLPAQFYDCYDRPKWRVEWLAEPKAGQPLVLHLTVACSSHLVQILEQANAGAKHGEVRVLRATNDHEWWPELEDD